MWLNDKIGDGFEWLMDEAGALIIFGIIALVVGGLGYGLWYEANSDHYALNKNEWHCSHSHTIYVPVSTGKTTVIIPEEICDTYRMNGYD